MAIEFVKGIKNIAGNGYLPSMFNLIHGANNREINPITPSNMLSTTLQGRNPMDYDIIEDIEAGVNFACVDVVPLDPNDVVLLAKIPFYFRTDKDEIWDCWFYLYVQRKLSSGTWIYYDVCSGISFEEDVAVIAADPVNKFASGTFRRRNDYTISSWADSNVWVSLAFVINGYAAEQDPGENPEENLLNYYLWVWDKPGGMDPSGGDLHVTCAATGNNISFKFPQISNQPGYFAAYNLDICAFNGYTTEISEESKEVGKPSGPGGYGGGGWDFTSDTLLPPTAPPIGMSATGFIHIYNPTISGLSGLGAELLPQLTFNPPSSVSTGLSVADAIINGFNNAAAWLANVPDMIANAQRAKMIDYVVDCHLIPCQPTIGGNEYIRVGYRELNIEAPVVTSDYVEVSLGSLNLREFYENFADYLATARLHVPFIGFVSMQPEWFNNATISLKYIFNVIDGSFVAVLYGWSGADGHLMSQTILGQWGGSSCIHIPITGPNYSAMMSGAIGGAAGAIMAAGTGNLAGAATSAINAASARGTVEQSNSYSASASFLGCRQAFILIERPHSFYSANYQHEIGIPANIFATLGSVSGFVKMDDVHLDGIDLTEGEKEELRSLLAGGVIN